jgi:hypothetical protein
VQTFVDLVSRHEARFYHFVHQVHSKGEGLFDNLMKWIELFINFVRSGLPSPVSLDFLLPVVPSERAELFVEVDAIIEYHRKLKAAHHERMRRRMIRGEGQEADKDAAFVSGVMENLHIGGVMGDIGDDRAESSEEGGSDDDSEEEEEEDVGKGKALPSIPGGLEPIPKSKSGRRRDRIPILPPTLVLIPRLVPVFVELVRDELEEARRAARANPPAHQL